MSWNFIVKLALALFVAQFIVGFLEGVLVPPGAGALWRFVGYAVSFVACSAIFAFFATRQPTKPFAHAWLGLLLQVLVSVSLSFALEAWLAGTPWPLVAIDWAVLVCSLVVGTSVGSGLRHGATRAADA